MELTMTQLMNYYAMKGLETERAMDQLHNLRDPLHFAHMYDKLEIELYTYESLNDLFTDLIRTQGYA